ncbi:golgin subfamily A member 4-like isoform X4 [Ruditapes philippinarum]|uniref:golgin subfamily A member 4-like isoform X4 n=1 Tax=Ruditapes philippinarum TaxID=129788 RepID=UPI00295C254D|nr:golgin subfamily A member 4-like isoform X4 [Ruditapes philippinarum]
MASKCRKFVPNIFNKSKCQTCFGSKEQHSAEALENNKASRKVSKCGYLFVAPGYDFSNPLDKTRRWQRRFFVLYDDGELAYSVDENPDTVPQGVVDMNKCSDVKDASGSTSHQNSLAIITPEKTTYIKANSKEEIQWWHDVLIVYPRSVCKPKQRRFTVPSYSFLNKENLQPKSETSTDNKDGDTTNGGFEIEKVKPKEQQFSTYRGVRSMKHTKENKHYQDGLRKSSSLHDLSTEERESGSLDNSRFLSRSGEGLDAESAASYSDGARLLSGYGNNSYMTVPRTTAFKPPSGKSLYTSNQNSSSNTSIASAPSSTSETAGMRERRGSFDDKSIHKSRNASERARLHRERSASMKSFPTNLTLPKITSSSVDRLLPRTDSSGQNQTDHENETDEHKMAKSSEMQSVSRSTPPPPSPTRQGASATPGTKFETSSESPNHVRLTLESPDREQDLMYMKKGWLIKMGTSEKDWKKHWFVLTGNSLRYYKDAKAEETNNLDGRIDLSSCYDISEVQIQRNYGFKIKTRNGEYVLSAMTSGIRSNWMKAIRLCMDLQKSNKNKESKSSIDSTASSSTARTNDDMDVDTSSSSSRTSDSARGPEKKKFIAKARRHYSDVNPGNIGKMFSLTGSSSGSSLASSKEPSLEREIKPESSLQTHMDLATAPKHGKYEPYWHGEAGSNIPFRRFVEGSDSHVTSSTSSIDQSNKSDKYDEEERKKHGKSPSAKIKERSRAKSPKLHSPPPGETESKFTYMTESPGDDEKMSVSSEDLDYLDAVDDDHLEGDDNLPASAGEGMLVDLLENEVESLKERLEHTQQELAKSHDSNRDLKTKLQTVVREKDPSQTYVHSLCAVFEKPQHNAVKRQLKENKDTVVRQKSEIDQLKSKLDMSTSKLTGTEKALSEALKDVKQEKDKFLKVSTEYNRKVRNLENQLKEVTQKMEKYHENSLIKDKENRKLDLELKQTQQKLRDHDREILKLKAVEHEYRQTKEKLDDTEKIASRMRAEIKEKDQQLKKIEIEYDEQYEQLMHEFSKERDATEHHIEELKEQLVEAQKKSTMSDQVSSDVAEMLREKDEIIAQLEEKVIESETKMVEITEELKEDEEENSELHQSVELLEEERNNCIVKITDLEKSLQHYQNQSQRMEKENASIRKHMDDLRKENTELSERLNSENNLVEDNDSLKITVKELENEVHSLHEELNKVVDGHERVSHSSDGTNSHDHLHTFIHASSEINDVNDNLVKVRKQFESIVSNSKGDQKAKLTSVAEMLESLGQKCGNVSDILKEGSQNQSAGDVIEKQTATVVQSGKDNQEVESLKNKNKQAQAEAEKLKKELSEVNKKYKVLQNEDGKLKEQIQVIEGNCKDQLKNLSKRVEEFTVVNKVKVDTKSNKSEKKQSKSKSCISDQIEEQLNELEMKVGMVEKVLNTHDLSISSIEADSHAETEDESEAEADDSDDYLDSNSEESEPEDDGDDSTVADDGDSLLGKLKEMKKQLQSTNNRIKELTGDISELDSSGVGSEVAAETELRHTLLKCGEKIDNLTVRLSDGLKTARSETPRFSDNTWAFQKCVGKLKEKVTEVSVLMHEHDELNAKELKHVQEKLTYLAEFVNQIDRLGDSDWEIAGKIAKQELKFQHLLVHKEKAARKSTLKYEDRLQLYADKLAFEAMILGQMGILIQRQQVGSMYKDVLLREIHEANLHILELERRIDNVTREVNQTDQEKDLVSSYAAILAEKIVLEGQLASGAMVQDMETSENVEVLSALNVNESPAVLAMEIFLRSQVDSSVTEQLQKFAEGLNSFSNHIVTRALLQGEITHALQVVKKKFKKGDNSEDLSSLVKRERQFAFDELQNRHKLILDLMNESEPSVMTTLIQLIEFSQGPNSPTLNSVCEKISSVLKNKIDELEKSVQSSDTETKTKLKHIISHLQSELTDAISIFREEHQCYVQTASPDINPNVLKFSADSLSTDLAEMIIQKAVISGTFVYVQGLVENAPDVAVSHMMEPIASEGQGLSDLAKSLGQILLTEAANKQKIAEEVRNVSSSDGSGVAKSVADLVGVIPDLEAYPQSFDVYAATLVREAMFQSQLTYTTYKLKLQYHRELRDIKIKMEAGEKVVLPSEISREAESDIQASLATFEEILNTKYQDECEVLHQLEVEIDNLKSVTGDKSCSKCKTFETTLKALEKTYQHEVSVAQERQNVHTDVLRQEVNNVIIRVDKFLEDHEREKESMIADYEDRIATLQDEFDLMRIDHEEELEQVKQDIMTAVSAIKATEEETETTSIDQIKHHNKQLMKMCTLSKELLLEVKNGVVVDQGEELNNRIESQLSQIMELESDPSFTLEVTVTTPSPTSPGSPQFPAEPLPKLERSLKLDRSLSAERSDEHVDKLLERSQHEHEMELLKREKEEALADEIKVTKAALDAMRKAYEEELEQEKEKYRHALKTMFTDGYVDEIRRRHDEEADKLSEELRQVSMHYESKCEDYKLLEDRLARTKTEYQTHINQLVKSNEHLTEVVNTEIENLKSFIQTRTKGQLTGSASLEEELYDAQIMVRVKDAELQKLRQQVKNLENSLERITEEQRYTMTQYLQCLKKNQEIQAKLKEGTFMSKERKDSTSTPEDPAKGARALRRNPSFHQRARSPSPETSPRKDGSEHHSRDSVRRRGHLSAKDLKRSKSSPSLPFVFEAKGTASASGAVNRQAQNTGVNRRESGKYSKGGKK